MSVDTDGILDRCSECGARAGFKMHDFGWSVECSECANMCPVSFYKDKAMIKWNIQNRKASTSKDTNI
jgi:hypothetical protein